MSDKTIAKVWLFPSETTPTKPPYQTLLYADGTTSCNCRGWTTLKKNAGGVRSCRHTRLVDMGQADDQAKSFKVYDRVVVRSTASAQKASPVKLSGRRFSLEA